MRFLDEPTSEEPTEPGTLERMGQFVGLPIKLAGAAGSRVLGAVTGADPEAIYQAGAPFVRGGLEIGTAMTLPMFKGLGQTSKALPFLSRMAAQGGLAGTESALKGGGPADVGWNALLGAGGQAAGEAVALPFRGGFSIQRALKLGAEHTEALKEYAEQQASDVVSFLKERVPALGDLGTGAKGLFSMLYGKGRDLVKQHYANYLESAKDAVGDARASFALEDLQALRIKPVSINEKMGTAEAFVRDVIEKVTGKSKTNPDVFRRVVTQLDNLEVLDPAERAAYRTYEGVREHVDVAKALRRRGGVPEFLPDKMEAAATDWKKLQKLYGRGLGSAEEGVAGMMNVNPPPAPPIARVGLSPVSLYHAGRTLAGHPGGIAGLIAGQAAKTEGGLPFAANTQAVDELLTRLPAGLAALVRAWLQP